MSRADAQARSSGQADPQATAGREFEPRRLGQTSWGILCLILSLVWLAVFVISLAHMPDAQAVAKAPEIVVTATYLPDGKSRLGFTAPDGVLQRHHCDAVSRLCRFVKQHAPVELTVRLAGPDRGMPDQAVLSARAGGDVLVTPAEGDANLASLKNRYRGGLLAALAALALGGIALRRTRI